MKATKYLLSYLLIIHFCLPFFIPLETVFHSYRMNYNLVKDNTDYIDFILGKISHKIKAEDLENYIIILGDSVAFSGPGPSSESIGYYMKEFAQKDMGKNAPVIFNLSLPAMQIGDIYTMLLKLDKYSISTDNIIFNVIYAGFVDRQPYPPAIFWLSKDYKELAPQSFEKISPKLAANNCTEKNNLVKKLHIFIEDNLSLYKYKDLLKISLIKHFHLLNKKEPTDDSLGDSRPWYEKQGLRELLQQSEYQKGFSDQPFDMTYNNPQIYFLNKIIEHQQGQHNLVFLAGTNEELMHDEVSSPGYKDNLSLIDQYFNNQDLSYINLQGEIDSDLFIDHIHLDSVGYKNLTEILWQNFYQEM